MFQLSIGSLEAENSTEKQQQTEPGLRCVHI